MACPPPSRDIHCPGPCFPILQGRAGLGSEKWSGEGPLWGSTSCTAGVQGECGFRMSGLSLPHSPWVRRGRGAGWVSHLLISDPNTERQTSSPTASDTPLACTPLRYQRHHPACTSRVSQVHPACITPHQTPHSCTPLCIRHPPDMHAPTSDTPTVHAHPFPACPHMHAPSPPPPPSLAQLCTHDWYQTPPTHRLSVRHFPSPHMHIQYHTNPCPIHTWHQTPPAMHVLCCLRPICIVDVIRLVVGVGREGKGPAGSCPDDLSRLFSPAQWTNTLQWPRTSMATTLSR